MTFLDRRAGHFSLGEGNLVFSYPDDEEFYEASMNQFHAWSARLVALRQQLVTVIQQGQSDAECTIRKP